MPFEISRGTNISHWLSQTGARGEDRRNQFRREDAEFCATIGLDHLRLPIDEEQMWDADGNAEEEAFGLLQEALDWSADLGLRVVIDLHILRSHHFNTPEKSLWTSAEAQERFCQCWRELSGRLGGRPNDMVAYELLNEAVANDPEDWNRVAHMALAAVRELEPDRIVVLGSNQWNQVHTFDVLAVPDDENLILTFHLYEPMLLTHYRASWTPLYAYNGPVHYPGVVVAPEEWAAVDESVKEQMRAAAAGMLGVDEEAMRKLAERHMGECNRDVLAGMVEKALVVARQHGLPLYCGEWGCMSTVPEPDRLRWYADMRSILEESGIAWTTWDYKSGHFGLRPGRELNEALIKTLLP
jgi:endoglucanase